MSESPHSDVAERFRYFLEAHALSREAFVEAVDGAITARSLFAISSGARRPSRSLAVLMERTWGFRADFLLEGEGAMWTEPVRPRAPRLAESEQRVVTFMRRSVENAATIERELVNAELWERLFARTGRLLAELEAAGVSTAPDDLALYPAFARLVLAESRLIAERFEQLVALQHRRRVRALTRRFVRVFVERLPRRHLTALEASDIAEVLAPGVERGRADDVALDRAIDALRETLENVCELGSPLPMLRARSASPRLRRMREATERLRLTLTARRSRRRGPDPALEALAALESATPKPEPFAARLRRLAEAVLLDLREELPSIPPQSVTELEGLHRAIAEPLIG